jgi:hypothetical protein
MLAQDRGGVQFAQDQRRLLWHAVQVKSAIDARHRFETCARLLQSLTQQIVLRHDGLGFWRAPSQGSF